jgi:hypothetical protein
LLIRALAAVIPVLKLIVPALTLVETAFVFNKLATVAVVILAFVN